ncbi:YbjQ family protein [Sulfurisphaera tokodaii]|uniref:UPF0145 protein STK_10800 n=2 Tax=Sulfurisphaera tokodaii TaxID=111955 RepID=Y1080_SULTO|nr:heavy metal-binding domain-containing protein [Sulfurisphaera tokodaii]Q972Q3.1 RecName: Full=UPF0145 protein STK_10800 [Sulfurisphaera tokodaii str. 7]BAB66111.1 hypothetical protein STK_10800 [Sulfurisphaera tokodaii str. 7]HII75407.1 heavy metal-binding domain-containing protein [Sulfurisphaera tokodaii]
MSFRESDILITTAQELPGYKIVEVKGVVIGITVRSRGLGGNIAASFRSLIGGEIKEYVEMAEQARMQALERMIERAKALGANAVISVRFDSNELAQNMDEIIAYGTAVVVTKSI